MAENAFNLAETLMGSASNLSIAGGIGSAALGSAELIDSLVKRKKANKAFGQAEGMFMDEGDVPGTSMAMLQAAKDYRRKAANLGTGIEYANEFDQYKTLAAGGFRNIVNRGGSEALLARLIGGSINQALEKGSEGERFYNTLFMKAQEGIDADRWRRYQSLSDIMAGKRNLQLAKYSQLMGSSAESASAGFDNLMVGGIGTASGVLKTMDEKSSIADMIPTGDIGSTEGGASDALKKRIGQMNYW